MPISLSNVAHFGPRTQFLFDTIGFTPTPKQVPILQSTKSRLLVSGGEQAGKSVVGSKLLIKRFPEDLAFHRSMGWPLPMIYWLVAEDYEGTRREFEYLLDDLQALQWYHGGTAKKLDPGYIEIGGGGEKNPVLAIIKTKSANNFRTLRMEAPAGILGCEASQLDLVAYERLRGRQAPHRGWLAMTGTMEGSMGWYPQLQKAWQFGTPIAQSFQLPSYSNHYLYPGGIDDEAIQALKEESTDEWFMERIEGKPAPAQGIVFPEFNPDIHVGDVVFDDLEDVQVWEDPGYGSSPHAILAVQIIDGQVRIFDEIYEKGVTTEVLIEDWCKHRPWWRNVTERIGDPHYGSQHHGGDSIDEIWQEKAHLKSFAARERLLPRIERAKWYLSPNSDGSPRTIINPKCSGILSELGMVPNPFDKQEHSYRYRTDKDGNAVGNEPKDEYNHSLEAYGRGIVYNFGHVKHARRRGLRVTRPTPKTRGRRSAYTHA